MLDFSNGIQLFNSYLPPSLTNDLKPCLGVVLAVAAILLTIRYFVKQHILLPIAVSMIPFKIGTPVTKKEWMSVTKFCKYGWHATVYTSLLIWNIQLLVSVPWALDFEGIRYIPTYNDTHMDMVKLFIWVQAGWYVHGMVESVLVDSFRADYILMLIHHFVAVVLLLGCWVFGCTRVGILITLEQDVADIVVYIAKMFDKVKSDPETCKALPGTELAHTVGVFAAAITWFIFRWCCLGYIMYIVTTTSENLFRDFGMAFLYVFLCMLLVLQIIWGLGVYKMCYDQITRGTFIDYWHDGTRRKNASPTQTPPPTPKEYRSAQE